MKGCHDEKGKEKMNNYYYCIYILPASFQIRKKKKVVCSIVYVVVGGNGK